MYVCNWNSDVNRRTRRRLLSVPCRPHGLALAITAAFWQGGTGSAIAGPPLLPGTVAGRTVWQGAEVSAGNGTTDLVIRQSTPRAQLWWDRFDIDRGQTVRFDQQGNRNWVALNWIDDARPSVIAGRLVADGQVYLINRNGIIFKPGAQVDATSFIASTLALQDDAFVRGLTALRGGRATFERSANAPTSARIEVQSGPVTTLAGQPVLGPNGQQLLEAARITSADGGRVFLFATSEVINHGLISSPNGQIVLAAGQKVYLFAPTTQDSAAFRGLFVEVGSGGEARNLGTLVSDRGNTSLVGLAVNNEGRISARSALSGNGSVWLLARSDLPESFNSNDRPTPTLSGTVTLGPRSRIELQPVSEVGGNGLPLTAIDGQQAFPSQVRIEGSRIALQGDVQGGASIVAPGGQVSIVASDVPNEPYATDQPLRPDSTARVYVGPKVEISVAGTRDVQVSAERNLLDVELRGENLGDSVALRSPSLAGSTLRVDLRTGSPLFSRDTLNRLAAQQIGRTVEERSATAGSIRIQSDGDAIVEPGARFDVSGGWLRYLPAVLPTSTLFDGQRTIDVSQASSNTLYQRADTYRVTDARWGVTRSWSFAYRGRRDPGYLEGLPAGSLQLNAPFLTMNGQLDGSVLIGARQTSAPPVGGLLTFGDQLAYRQSSSSLDFRLQAPVRFEPLPEAAPVGENADRVAVFGDPATPNPLRVDTQALAARGVSRIEVFTNDEVTVPAGARVELPAGGRLTVAAGGGVTVRGDIVVPGAREQVVHTSGITAVSRGIDLSGVPVQGAVVGALRRPLDVSVVGATVSAAGQWRVDAVEPAVDAPSTAAVVNGGSIRLSSPTSVSLDALSSIDVSAGARMSSTRALTPGTAGQIELLSTDSGNDARAASGRMSVAGTLSGYGFATGGALRIDAADVVVGASAPGTALSILPGFFLTGGFSDYDLRGQSTLTFAPGAAIRPSQLNRRFDPDGAPLADGGALRVASPIVQRPDTERRPVSVAFRAPSVYRGVLEQPAGGDIAVERGGRITLEAGLSMAVEGRLEAPGGTIAAAVGIRPGSGVYLGFRGNQGLYVGPAASVSVDGVDATWRDSAGRINGSVLAGGTISFDAWDGYLVLDTGSRFSARGASGTVLTRSIDAPDAAPTERSVPSDGGAVRFAATNGGALAPRVDVYAGGAGAANGTLEIRVPDLQTEIGPLGSLPTGLQTTAVVADAAAIPAGVSAGTDLDLLRNGPTDTTSEEARERPTLLTVAASVLAPGAARDRLIVEARGRISLEGGTALGAVRELRLDAPAIAVAPSAAGTEVSVRAPYVALGNSRVRNELEGTPSGGSGTLSVDAPIALDLVGGLALQGVSRTTLASNGDLRLIGLYRDTFDRVLPYAEGLLTARGSVELIARRLFPTTFTRYAITVGGEDGTLRTVARGEDPGAPLSAGGSISMQAAEIDLAGRVYAPQGQIALDATGALSLRDGARVSVVGGELPVPLGDTQDQRRIAYTFTPSSVRDVSSLPRAIALSGESIRLEAGTSVDASGGGEVLASSFVASSRGSSNLLQRPNAYAVIPGLNGVAPYDFVAQNEMVAARTTPGDTLAAFRGALPSTVGVAVSPTASVGDQVYLSGSAGLPAGVYTLLPARYATLPGAFVVLTTTSREAAPARNTTLVDGSALVAGYRIADGVGRRDTRWANFNVLPAATVNQYGEFVTDSGTRFFAAEAARTEAVVPRLPADAGTVTLSARGTTLDLSGALALRGAPATASRPAGRAGELEIAAQRIAVIEGGSAPDGFVGVPAARLRELQAERVVIGGRSEVTTDLTVTDTTGALRTLTTVAQEVRVQPGARLEAQEVSLVATERVTLGQGAQIVAQGGPSSPERLDTGVAAYLGVTSNSNQSLSVPVASAARVELGSGSLLQGVRASISAPGGAAIDPSVDLRVKGLSAASERVVLGGTDTAVTGTLVLTDGLLAALGNVDALALSASREIALSGGARLGTSGLGTLALRAPQLVRTGSQAPVEIIAGALDWRWSGAPAAAPGVAAVSTLSVTVSGRPGDPARDGSVTFGEGSRRIDGFERTTITSSAPVRVDGTGSTTVNGSLAIDAPVIAVQAGATQRIEASGTVVTRTVGTAASDAGPGGRLVLEARRVDHGGVIDAPSGEVRLNATGPDDTADASIVLRPGSRIDARGATVETLGFRYGTAGGSVGLSSTVGSIDARAGSEIKVAAGPGDAAGGAVSVEAPNGRVTLASSLDGRATGADRTVLSVDGGVVSDPSGILREAQRSGIDGSVSIRARSGDLAIVGAPATTLLGAREITLSADSGNVSLVGARLDAGGASGGRIALEAGGAVLLDATSELAARGSVGRGGEVGLSGAVGMSAAAGARIDVTGTTGGGIVDVRVPAERLADVAIAAGVITGASETRLTFVQRYDGISEVTNQTPGSDRLALTDAFAAASAFATPANVALTVQRLGVADPSTVRLRPEIEVRSAPGGDIVVREGLDFSTARFTSATAGDTAGVLTLAADRNLLLMGGAGSTGLATAVLNDGFGGVSGSDNTLPDATFMGAVPATWSFRLAAGVDRASADPTRTRAASDPRLAGIDGRIAVGNGQAIRTGTGSITLAAARDILLGVDSETDLEALTSGVASIFTAGREAPALDGFRTPVEEFNSEIRPVYTQDGGDISLRAGGSILAAESRQIASSWLFRSGQVSADGTLVSPLTGVSWWPEFRYFTQSVGALGGGTVRIEAGADVRNVSAAVGTSGRLPGTNTFLADPVVTGGGRLDVRAGGSIGSGTFTVMRGTGRIVAGDTVTATREGDPLVPTLVALGDASVAIQARQDLRFGLAYNPTLAPQRTENARFTLEPSHFSTYGEASELSLTSLSGSVYVGSTSPMALVQDSGSLDTNSYIAPDVPMTLWPARLRVRAPEADLQLNNVDTILLSPSARGQLDVVVGRSIIGNSVFQLAQSDADPVLAFSVRQPFAELIEPVRFSTNEHAQVPVHRGDDERSRLIAGRDITGPSGLEVSLSIVTAEALEMNAGRDIRNVAASVQNTRDSDVTRVVAGRDVVNETEVSALGRLQLGSQRGIVVTGPGRLDIRAARDIAMGTSRGILTRGNLDNLALPEQGASIVLVAGLPEDPAYDAFLAAYAGPASSGRVRSYQQAMIDFVSAETGSTGLDAAAAWTQFQALPIDRRSELARSLFFLELRTAGRSASDPSGPAYRDFQTAYDAMAVMFPKDGQGNVDLVFSQVATARGGDVRIMAPGVVCRGAAADCASTEASQKVGNVSVGLTSPPAELLNIKPASQLGIFTLQGGDIQAAVGNDLAVNRSRILTVAGGGITLFSATGDIDAGRGSKTATSSPPPLVRVDTSGNVVVELPGVVEGSGIGVLVTQPGVVPGDIDLFAPKGIIDAGEAGIRAAGNITVFATQVLNASNIQVGGASTGVPTVTAAPNLSLANSSSTASGALRSGTDAAERAASDAANRPRASQRILILEFLGFGDEGEDAWQRRRASRAR
jgi:filamentous hemagglutinin